MRRCRLVLCTLLMCACTREPAGSDPAEIVFLEQDVATNEVMQALFEGRVVADSAGCLRLHSDSGATVVWPKGFRLEKGGELRVVDGGGRVVSNIGGEFHLGGGELSNISGFSESLQQKARMCPGLYWIVGEYTTR